MSWVAILSRRRKRITDVGNAVFITVFLPVKFAMFIGIVGSRCSGKRTIAEYLVQNHGFKLLSLRNHKVVDSDSSGETLEFDTQEQLQEFVTERWRENFVTCDLDSCGVHALK